MMKIIKEIDVNIKQTSGSVVAIGNFDGVHIGHQSLIKLILKRAKSANQKSGILTFEPHPREFFDNQKQNFKIMTLEARREKLARSGLDFIIELPFNNLIPNMDPEKFVEEVLHKNCEIKHVIIGKDFRFGKARSGNADTLKVLGKKFGIDVEVLKIKKTENLIISSTRVRNLIEKGEIEAANDLLGSYHSIRGTVQKGEQRGRQMNFPTANIHFGNCIVPRYGVYASRIRLLGSDDKTVYQGATSIGTRPTFGVNQPNLEIYIFEFDREIYGAEIEVELNFFVRPEVTFSDTAALIKQMEKDCTDVRKLLKSVQSK